MACSPRSDFWSEVNKRRLWRRIWVALATVQAKAGLVTEAQLAELRAHQDAVDWERAQEIEDALRHDLMAEIKTYAEQCPSGGAIIHLGATSMDIEDNADALRLREALALVRKRLVALLAALVERIEAEAETVVMAYTHIQPAEPTTLGYRLSQYAQDFFEDLQAVDRLLPTMRGKGFKGAVGTSASSRRHGPVGEQILSRSTPASIARLWRDVRAFRQTPGGFIGNAL